MLKEAVSYPLKYVRDKNGNTPLTLALKRFNYDAVNLLLEYISNSDKLTAQLSNEELCNLLRFSPSYLPEFLKKAVVVITKDVPKLGTLRDKKEITFS